MLPLQLKQRNSTLIATAGEKGKVYVLRCVNCVHYSLKLNLNYLVVGFIGIIKIRDLPMENV